MEFTQVVRRRRMVRNYDPDRPVPAAVVAELLELALHAPSAGFSQGWHFLVLDTPASRAAYWQATRSADESADNWLTGMLRAPVLIVALSDQQAYLDRYAQPDKGWTDRSRSRWPVPYWDIDTGMASLLILLGAVDAGLDGCLFGVPVEAVDAVRTAFGIDDRFNLVGVLSLGYRAPDRRSPSLRRGRRPVTEVVSYNHM